MQKRPRSAALDKGGRVARQAPELYRRDKRQDTTLDEIDAEQLRLDRDIEAADRDRMSLGTHRERYGRERQVDNQVEVMQGLRLLKKLLREHVAEYSGLHGKHDGDLTKMAAEARNVYTKATQAKKRPMPAHHTEVRGTGQEANAAEQSAREIQEARRSGSAPAPEPGEMDDLLLGVGGLTVPDYAMDTDEQTPPAAKPAKKPAAKPEKKPAKKSGKDKAKAEAKAKSAAHRKRTSRRRRRRQSRRRKAKTAATRKRSVGSRRRASLRAPSGRSERGRGFHADFDNASTT